MDVSDTAKWMQKQSVDSILIQIGANDHAPNNRVRSHHDPALLGISLGWRALLLEPTPFAFWRLQARYAGSLRVRTRHAAVCGNKPANPPCTAEQDRMERMWIVDPTNATGNWGSEDADMRCITELEPLNITSYHYLLELASFELGHVLKHQNNLIMNAPKNCRVCSKVQLQPSSGGVQSRKCSALPQALPQALLGC